MRKLIHETAFAVFTFDFFLALVAALTGYRLTASGCAALCVAAYMVGWFTVDPKAATFSSPPRTPSRS